MKFTVYGKELEAVKNQDGWKVVYNGAKIGKGGSTKQKAIKIAKENIEHRGEKDFLKACEYWDNRPSDERKAELHREWVDVIEPKFKSIFGFNPPYSFMSYKLITGIRELCPLELETRLSKRGYDPNGDQSLREFITERYGKEATDFAESLLTIK